MISNEKKGPNGGCLGCEILGIILFCAIADQALGIVGHFNS